MVTKQEIPKWKCRSGVTSNFGPHSRRISKIGPQIPYLALYGLKMGFFCLDPAAAGPEALLVTQLAKGWLSTVCCLDAAVYTPFMINRERKRPLRRR